MSTDRGRKRSKEALCVIGVWVAIMVVGCAILSIPGVVEFLNSTAKPAGGIDYEERCAIMEEALEQISAHLDTVKYSSEMMLYGSSGAWLLLTGQDPDYDSDAAAEEIENSWSYYNDIEGALSAIDDLVADALF